MEKDKSTYKVGRELRTEGEQLGCHFVLVLISSSAPKLCPSSAARQLQGTRAKRQDHVTSRKAEARV